MEWTDLELRWQAQWYGVMTMENKHFHLHYGGNSYRLLDEKIPAEHRAGVAAEVEKLLKREADYDNE